MKKIKTKNYIILILLILVTVLITLVLANLYNNTSKKASQFYEYANKISTNEFDQYILESVDTIVYISDKYNNEYSKFEEEFKEKIIQYNLKDKLIYIERNNINKKFLSKLKKQYDVSIDLSKSPIVLIISDKKIYKQVYIDGNTDVDTFIEYEDLK